MKKSLKITNNKARISCAQKWQDDQCKDTKLCYCQVCKGMKFEEISIILSFLNTKNFSFLSFVIFKFFSFKNYYSFVFSY